MLADSTALSPFLSLSPSLVSVLPVSPFALCPLSSARESSPVPGAAFQGPFSAQLLSSPPLSPGSTPCSHLDWLGYMDRRYRRRPSSRGLQQVWDGEAQAVNELEREALAVAPKG